jgi:hypothetical protein
VRALHKCPLRSVHACATIEAGTINALCRATERQSDRGCSRTVTYGSCMPARNAAFPSAAPKKASSSSSSASSTPAMAIKRQPATVGLFTSCAQCRTRGHVARPHVQAMFWVQSETQKRRITSQARVRLVEVERSVMALVLARSAGRARRTTTSTVEVLPSLQTTCHLRASLTSHRKSRTLPLGPWPARSVFGRPAHTHSAGSPSHAAQLAHCGARWQRRSQNAHAPGGSAKGRPVWTGSWVPVAF